MLSSSTKALKAPVAAVAPMPRSSVARVQLPRAPLSGMRVPHHSVLPTVRAPLCRVQAATAESNGVTATSSKIPTPVVKIDNLSDAFATVVSVEFGDRLGELLDTITALKNLGLNISRAKLDQSNKEKKNRNVFYITDATTSEKILKSDRLEDIRMTIINNMLYYHPESAEALAAGSPAAQPERDVTRPLGPRTRAVVQTTIEVEDAKNGSCSLLKVSTRDRPGLLVDIVRVLKDINVNVVSAEIDTLGRDVNDEFFVTYHGEALSAPMVQLVTNALQYYLSLAEIEKEESY